MFFFLGTDDEYEIGDLSGKYGSFLNFMNYRKEHTDYNLPLFGRNSIQGRSVVIHKLKIQDNNARWVCNNIKLEGVPYVMKAYANFSGPTLTGMIIIVSSNVKNFNSFSFAFVHKLANKLHSLFSKYWPHRGH